MTTGLILYGLLPIIGTVMLLMVMDKRIKAVAIIRMFWNAFKGVPPVREEDQVRVTADELMALNLAVELMNLNLWRHFLHSKDSEKVDWKKEGF